MKLFRNIWFILTMTCHKSAEIISRAEETPLTRIERIALKGHLLICHYCRYYQKQLRLLQIIFKKFSSLDLYDDKLPNRLSDKKKQEIKDRLKH